MKAGVNVVCPGHPRLGSGLEMSPGGALAE